MIEWLADPSATAASGGWTDMLFVAGAGALMLVAIGALAAVQSRGADPSTPERDPAPADTRPAPPP